MVKAQFGFQIDSKIWLYLW